MRRIHHREEIRLKCELKEQAERESFAYTRFARVTQCRVFGTWLARYRDTSMCGVMWKVYHL